MNYIRTVVWVVLLIALLVFSINNWAAVDVKIWEGLILETKLPALVVISFLLGLVPMWLLAKVSKWRMQRQIRGLQSTAATSLSSDSLATSTVANASPETPAS